MPRDESAGGGRGARGGCAGGAAAWLARWWRALLAELMATALLVWLGLSALTPVRGAASVSLEHPALAFGFVLVACVLAFGPTSGAHMNPAVTLAALLCGELAAAPALAYALVQVVGATLGFGALQAVAPAAAMEHACGVTRPAPGVSPVAAAALEAALTGTLVLAVCATWAAHDPARPDPAAPLKIGLVVAGLIFAGGHATGASLNPARSFGPALLQGVWTDHWVYWVGPLGGAALAALAHRYVLRPRAARAAIAPRDDGEVPLREKP